MKFKQLVAAPWEGSNGKLTATLFALDENGLVFRYKPAKDVFEQIGTGSARQHDTGKHARGEFRGRNPQRGPVTDSDEDRPF